MLLLFILYRPYQSSCGWSLMEMCEPNQGSTQWASLQKCHHKSGLKSHQKTSSAPLTIFTDQLSKWGNAKNWLIYKWQALIPCLAEELSKQSSLSGFIERDMEAAPSLRGLRSELQIQIQYLTNTLAVVLQIWIQYTTIFTFTAHTEVLEELFFPFYPLQMSTWKMGIAGSCLLKNWKQGHR